MEYTYKRSNECIENLKRIYKKKKGQNEIRFDINNRIDITKSRKDRWYYMRYHDAFRIERECVSMHHSQFVQKSSNLKLLVIIYGDFAEELFDIQNTQTKQRMALIRFKCMGLIRKREKIPIGAVSMIRNLCSVSLMNYCVHILNHTWQDGLENELKLSRRILNGGCHTISNNIR
eukprot:866735_1